MPAAARQGDLIGHAPPIPPVVAAAVAGGAVASGAANSMGGKLTSAALAGADAASGSGGGGGGVGGVVTGLIVPQCSGNVFTNGIPAARALIDKAACSLHPPVPLPIVSGSSNVFINGLPAARLGDKIFCGAVILSGSGNVFNGGSAGAESVCTDMTMPECSISPLQRDGIMMADAGAANPFGSPADSNLMQWREIASAPFKPANPQSQLVPIGRIESFFMFHPVGRFMKGWSDGVQDIGNLQRNIESREWSHIVDACGYAKQAVLGTEKGVMGDERPYQAKSVLFRSIEKNGVAATLGGGVHSLVTWATGVSTMEAIGSKTPETIGRTGPGILAAAIGGSFASRAAAINRAELSTLQKFDGIPRTGVDILDSPAISSSSFAQKMDALQRAGYQVKVNPLLNARGEFSPGKAFEFNPETLTRLDLAHEMRHFKQLRQMEESRLKLNSSAFRTAKGPAELGAYMYEEKLWSRSGLSPNKEYIEFHKQQLELYDEAMALYRREAAGKYGGKWRNIKW